MQLIFWSNPFDGHRAAFLSILFFCLSSSQYRIDSSKATNGSNWHPVVLLEKMKCTHVSQCIRAHLTSVTDDNAWHARPYWKYCLITSFPSHPDGASSHLLNKQPWWYSHKATQSASASCPKTVCEVWLHGYSAAWWSCLSGLCLTVLIMSLCHPPRHTNKYIIRLIGSRWGSDEHALSKERILPLFPHR